MDICSFVARHPEAIRFDTEAYDDAIVGYKGKRLVYLYNLMVEGLMAHEGWTQEEAMEWIDYNTMRALPYITDGPIVVYLNFWDHGFRDNQDYEPICFSAFSAMTPRERLPWASPMTPEEIEAASRKLAEDAQDTLDQIKAAE